MTYFDELLRTLAIPGVTGILDILGVTGILEILGLYPGREILVGMVICVTPGH